MGCEWLRCVIGECMQWVASGGAVSLGNATADGSEVEISREKC